jgi:hypothetical protein
MNSLRPLYEQLRVEWLMIGRSWNEVSAVWRDTMHARFEKQFWHEADRTLPGLLDNLAQMRDMIDRAHRELSE